MNRPETLDLMIIDGQLAVRCTLCGGVLKRHAPPNQPWNLWDLLDAMTQHEAGNHT